MCWVLLNGKTTARQRPLNNIVTFFKTFILKWIGSSWFLKKRFKQLLTSLLVLLTTKVIYICHGWLLKIILKTILHENVKKIFSIQTRILDLLEFLKSFNWIQKEKRKFFWNLQQLSSPTNNRLIIMTTRIISILRTIYTRSVTSNNTSRHNGWAQL